ncbi:hypothetical protein [Xanthobacter autotrophicus]|uniref:hypothetical protein n=1 Tax=Xanthobacter autotrophicus TaxID=280 RepID=UPI00372A54DD
MTHTDLTTRDLIDLAIEYEMVASNWDFQSRSKPVQEAILKQMRKLAEGFEW